MNFNQQIQNINIDKIIPNRFQPRLSFDDQSLNELALSIKEHGIIQPLVLRKLGDKYEIIAGERRYKAATRAGLTEVPAIISNLDDNQSAEVALVENIQRKNLNSIEEAKSYRKILDKGVLTQESLAKKMGISQSAIANKLRLLNLTNEVQEAVVNEKISERHARSLLQVPSMEDQIKLLNQIIDNRLTVKQLDQEIQNLYNVEKSGNNNIEDLVPINEELDNISSKNPLLNKFNIFDNPNPYPSLEEEKTNMSFENIDMLQSINHPENETSETLEDSQNISENVLNNNIFDLPSDLENKIVDNNEIQNNNNNNVESIEEIKKLYQEIEAKIKKSGFIINSEEFDFQDLYQLIIKISK